MSSVSLSRVGFSNGARLNQLKFARRLSSVAVLLILLIQTYPILWTFLTALRPPQEFAGSNAFGWPSALTLENFVRAFAQGRLGLYFTNSLVVTTASIGLIVALSMTAAYAIQIIGFRFSRVVLGLFLAGIIVPVQVALIPLFLTYSALGVLNTYASLILPMVGFALPMSVYLFVSFLPVHLGGDHRGSHSGWVRSLFCLLPDRPPHVSEHHRDSRICQQHLYLE